MLENIQRYFRYYLALLLALLLALGARVQAAPLRPGPCAVSGGRAPAAQVRQAAVLANASQPRRCPEFR